MYELREIKKKARIECMAVRDAIAEDKKAELDYLICNTFLNLASYRHADVILAYYPSGSEVDVKPLITSALAQGKKVALPFCPADDGPMRFYYIESLDNLAEGRFGIKCAPEGSELFVQSEKLHSVMMVPALAFDKKGYRLGYGKGYYDRYISKFCGVLAGFTYSSLVLDKVPTGKHDISVDYIVTDKGVKIIEKSGSK